MNLQDQIRAADTKRWITVRTAVNQSVSEHSHLTALIAMRICVLLARQDLAPACAAYACIHDIDEVITGDIPTNTKKRFDESTRESLYKYSENLARTLGIVSGEIKDIVKVAERLEEAFFIRANGLGTHADQVTREILNNLYADMEYIETPSWLAAKKVWEEITVGDRTW